MKNTIPIGRKPALAGRPRNIGNTAAIIQMSPARAKPITATFFCAILFSPAVCRCAGVPTPLTARLLALIHTVERGERPQSLVTLDALAVHAPV